MHFPYFTKSGRSSIPPAPKISTKVLPDFVHAKHASLPTDYVKPVILRYESDSEIPTLKRVISPSSKPPKSVTPHPRDTAVAKARRGSDSSDGFSRLRAVSQSGRVSNEIPLKSCLKPANAYPDHPSPRSRDTSQTRSGGWPIDAVYPSPKAIPYGHGLEPRPRSRHDLAPSGRHRSSSLSSSVRPYDLYGLSASEGTKTHHTVPLARGRSLRVPMKTEAIHLHWPLVHGFQAKPRHPPIFFDAAFDPRHEGNVKALVQEGSPYGVRHSMKPVASSELHAEASTHTTLTRMDIICPRGSKLPDAMITVQRPQGIRCIDVLTGIWDAYHRRVSSEDLATVGEAYIQRCEPHFKLRCQDSPRLALYEERRGMRYIDLLRGSRRRIFKGLVQTSGPGLVWKLHFEDPEQ